MGLTERAIEPFMTLLLNQKRPLLALIRRSIGSWQPFFWEWNVGVFTNTIVVIISLSAIFSSFILSLKGVFEVSYIDLLDFIQNF